jgi:hypothetical protein
VPATSSTVGSAGREEVGSAGREEVTPLPAEPSYGFPSFESTAERDGLVVVEVDEVDVATRVAPVAKLRHHFCEGRIPQVIVGEFQVGDPIRVSCCATRQADSPVPAHELAMAAFESTVAPDVGDDILVAPRRDEDDPSRFFAERRYFTDDGRIALDPEQFGSPDAVRVDGPIDMSSPLDRATTDPASFVALWHEAHAGA